MSNKRKEIDNKKNKNIKQKKTNDDDHTNEFPISFENYMKLTNFTLSLQNNTKKLRDILSELFPDEDEHLINSLVDKYQNSCMYNMDSFLTYFDKENKEKFYCLLMKKCFNK